MWYVFGDCTLDLESYELRQAGELVRLEPRVFDFLAYLVQHPDRTVTKEELRAKLWPDQPFMSDDPLTNCVAQARKALGDSGHAQRCIKTMHGRGYRFIVPVEVRLPAEMDVRCPPAVEAPTPEVQQVLGQVDAGSPPVLTLPLPAQLSVSSPELDSARAPHAAEPDRSEVEWRPLTVLACRLLRVAESPVPLDPELLFEVMQDYQAVCAEVVHRFNGHIAHYQVDQLTVYFGYPLAHEDNVRRAVQTGLELIEAMAALTRRHAHNSAARWAVQVGIHTGIELVGSVGHGDQRASFALRETPTLAAELQRLAALDTVLVSAAIWRLVEDYFVGEALDLHELQTATKPLAVYRVFQARPVQSRFEIAVSKGMMPLVGREQEVGLLLARWEQAAEGRGQVVLLSGEVGIGKSRLVQVLKERLDGEAHLRLEGQCSPYAQHTPFYPVVTFLRQFLRLTSDMSEAEKLRALEGALAPYGFAREAVVPLFAALLSVPLPATYAPLTFTPERQRQKTLEALLEWLLKAAERQPVCVIIEDLHWGDPSTVEWLGLLMEQVPTARILVLLTFRPEFQPPWGGHSHRMQLALDRLSPQQTMGMIQHVVQDQLLPAAVMQQVAAITDGVPLFVEELTKMVLESELIEARDGQYKLAAPLSPLAIPTTLHDSLMARLDRLGSAKQVAQLASILGREFSYQLMQKVSPLEEGVLQQALKRLVEAELLYQRGLLPQTRYVFKHALIQEVAYQSLLKRTRQQYHQQIAQVLAAQDPNIAALQPEVLAQHYMAAGLLEQALPYWQQAGQRAARHSAYPEALAHLQQGLATLDTLPDTREHRQQAFQLHATLGPVCMALYGHAAPEVEHAYRRARELSQEVQDIPALFPVLAGLAKFSIMRADFAAAGTLGLQCLTLAQQMPEAIPLVVAHWVVGATAVWQGHLADARMHLEQGLTQWDWLQYQEQQTRYPVVPGVQCLSYLTVLLWLQGYPERAMTHAHAALSLAHEVAHPYSLAMAHFYAARLYQACGERQAVRTQAVELITLSQEHRYAFWETQGHILQAWAQAIEEPEASLIQMRQGLQAYRATGAEIGREYFLMLLAEVAEHAGQPEVGLIWVDEAQAVTQATGAQYCTAELWRRQGELHARQTGVELSQVETRLQKALVRARQQQIKAWELRAAISLSRLWQQQGKRADAYALLAPLYDGFTEGFETADLREARALLKAL